MRPSLRKSSVQQTARTTKVNSGPELENYKEPERRSPGRSQVPHPTREGIRRPMALVARGHCTHWSRPAKMLVVNQYQEGWEAEMDCSGLCESRTVSDEKDIGLSTMETTCVPVHYRHPL